MTPLQLVRNTSTGVGYVDLRGIRFVRLTHILDLLEDLSDDLDGLDTNAHAIAGGKAALEHARTLLSQVGVRE